MPNTATIRHAYVDGAEGQIHVRMATPARPAGRRRAPVVLFHETPASSAEYEALIRELGADRVVIAVDTPGYGMSTAPDRPLSIAAYVDRIAPALQTLGVGGSRLGKAVVFGFHTGAVLAAEMAISRPGLVRALVVAGFPCRTPAERAERLAALPRDATVADHRSKVLALYDLAVMADVPDVPVDHRVQLFAEMMLAGRRHWFGYDAVWRWSCEERLPLIRQPALFLAPHEMLHAQTVAASRLVPGARLVDMPEATEWVLERNVPAIAAEIRRFVDH